MADSKFDDSNNQLERPIEFVAPTYEAAVLMVDHRHLFSQQQSQQMRTIDVSIYTGK